MPLDQESLLQIEAVVRRVVFGEQAGTKAAPRKLTVEEFAFCIQRSEEFVRRKIRAQVIPRNLVSGRPYLINAPALELFRVTPAMAAARLQEWREQSQPGQSQPSLASACDTASPQLP